MNPVVLGVILILVSFGTLILIPLVLRYIPRTQKIVQLPMPEPPVSNIVATHDAVLMVQPGGRVIYLNQIAREWFDFQEEMPGLERLARRTRPADVFLGLCVSEGQARFALDGRLVEGVSYYVPYLGQQAETGGFVSAMLVTLRRPQVASIVAGEPGVSEQALDIFSELSREMASSLELKTTLQAILDSVERLIPSDFPEITVWDPPSQRLIPYRFVGLVAVDRRLERAAETYQPNDGYTGYLVQERKPLLIDDVGTFRQVRPAADRKQYPFNAYLGIPLQVAGELIGTLELASLNSGAFSENDREVLKILAGQAAIALKNALLYEDEQNRIRELSGLAELAHSISELRDLEELFELLVGGIVPLIQVKTLGFLTYHENRRVLEAQSPFRGIPPQFIELYRAPIPPGSPAEQIWLKQEVILAQDAPNDPQLQLLGLAHLAQATGFQNTVLVPLCSGGRSLGYLQVADKENNRSFDADDLRLLNIIGGQAATIIENAFLIRDSQERAIRSEALRRIASLAGSDATLDEILTFSLREIARLLRADLAVIFLLDENTSELRVHTGSLYGITPDFSTGLGKISLADPQFRQTITGSKRPYLTGNLSEAVDLADMYRPIVDTFKVNSAVNVPLVVRGQGVGELMLGSRQLDFFSQGDLTLISTIASQLASATERTALYDQTDESLRRRVVQLTALARVSRELNTTLELRHLLQLVHDEALQTTEASCGSIVLFDPNSSNDPPRVSLAIGDFDGQYFTDYQLQVAHSGEALILNDCEESAETVTPPHQGIRSMMVVPISFQEATAGIIELHAPAVGQFDRTALEITQSLAGQASIALGNALRYQEQVNRTQLLNRRVETVMTLLETSRFLQADQPLEQSLESIAYGIQETTSFDVVLVSVYDPQTQRLKRLVGAGLPLDIFQDLKSHTQPWEAIEQFILPEYRLSQSYYIPHDRTPAVPPDMHVVQVLPIEGNGFASNEQAWHPQDLLLVPLLAANGQPVGLISVDAPRDGLRPDRPTIESLEIFASQAALVIEAYQKIDELRERSSYLQQELHRAKDAVQDTQRNLPVLLHKDLEQTIAIHRLNQRSRHIRTTLDIVDQVNRQSTRQEVLQIVGQQILTGMEMDLVLIGELSEGAPRILQVYGSLPAGVTPQALLGQRNPLRTTLFSGELELVANLEDNTEWNASPLLTALMARSFVCVPIFAGGGARRALAESDQVDTAILAINLVPVPAFTDEDKDIYVLLSNQVSVALENIRLLDQTNRRLQEMNLLLEFSRQLGRLDTISIVQSLVDSARKVVPEAQAGLVALWSPSERKLLPLAASGYTDNLKALQISYRSGEALPGKAYEQKQPVLVNEVNFAQDYNLPSENILLYRDATGGRLPISSLIVPLLTFDSTLGVLVLDNFKTTAAFTEEDQALVLSLARQTALTLENVRLYQASQERTEQLQALTAVAGEISASLQTSELVSSLLGQVRSIITFDTGTLWLRQGDQMIVRSAVGFADSEERVGLSVALEDSLLLGEMINTSRPLVVADVSQDALFPSLVEHPYLSWLGIPLLSKGDVAGVIVLEKVEPNFYTPERVQLVVTFAAQAAAALDNATLYEDSVRRAVELDQRSQRLVLLNRLSTSLSGSLDPDTIYQVTTQELQQALRSDGVTVVMFDDDMQAWVQAEVPQTSAQFPLLLPPSPIFARLQETLGLFSSEEITQEDDLIPLAPYFETRQARSVLILPTVSGNELFGLVLVHMNRSYRYSPDEVDLARTIVNQSAVAIQNARLFRQTERLFDEMEQRSVELSILFDLGVNITQVLDQSRLLNLAFENIERLLRPDSIVLVLIDEGNNLMTHVSEHGQLKAPLVAPRQVNNFSEYVLATNKPLLIKDTQANDLPVSGMQAGTPCRSWVGIPLVARSVAVGVLSIQSNTRAAFGDSHQRLLSQITNQLSVALDNAQLFAKVQNYAADLEQRVTERTDQLAREHRRTQTLLSIITELSASLDLDLVLSRTLSVVNETIDAEHSMILLVPPDGSRLYLRASLGYTGVIPKGGQESSLKLNEGLAGWVITNRQAALVDDLWLDPRWVRKDDRTNLHRSAMAVPLMVGEDILGVMMLYHREVNRFSSDQLDLIQATAKQIAIAINNAQLYNLIRDQAERLGDMLRTQHVETSRSQAILEAVADGVLVTDVRRQITLLNASAEHILGLDRWDVMGQSIEHFLGLFGEKAASWFETIQQWSLDPETYQLGDLYAEQIELDNRRVVAVHLSPVHLRSDFLGTVSIFRDITHMVEVDRLKSEFVATVSHELRTPMTSIKGYVEIMLMGAAGELNPQQIHFLEVVKGNTERLAILVNDLLDVSRIEAGKIILSFQPVGLDQIVEMAFVALEHRMKDENRILNLAKQIPPDLPRAIGDPERVLQIVENLVENAYQYTHPGGHILVRAFQVDGDIQVDVVDDGIGITEAEKTRIFERFFRGEDPLVLATSGTGLGLSIVQTLVSMHNGRIWFESSGIQGEGSIFSFTLPVAHAEKAITIEEDGVDILT